jgi:hypothetical protein
MPEETSKFSNGDIIFVPGLDKDKKPCAVECRVLTVSRFEPFIYVIVLTDKSIKSGKQFALNYPKTTCIANECSLFDNANACTNSIL